MLAQATSSTRPPAAISSQTICRERPVTSLASGSMRARHTPKFG